MFLFVFETPLSFRSRQILKNDTPVKSDSFVGCRLFINGVIIRVNQQDMQPVVYNKDLGFCMTMAGIACLQEI